MERLDKILLILGFLFSLFGSALVINVVVDLFLNTTMSYYSFDLTDSMLFLLFMIKCGLFGLCCFVCLGFISDEF